MAHHRRQIQSKKKQRAFAIGGTLNLLFVIAEAIFGSIFGSMALLADAGHNLSDVLGLLLAWGATILSQRNPTRRRTWSNPIPGKMIL